MKKSILKSSAVQTILASLLCILMGLFIGYLALLIVNPDGAWNAICEILKNFMHYSRNLLRLKHLGSTIVKTVPLLMCSLSVLFAYKTGLFNMGVAGQYVAGSCAAIYAALAWGWGWLPCVVLAIVAGAVFGMFAGLLKAYCNVNEVISGIMLNWITLYLGNMLLTPFRSGGSPYTMHLREYAESAVLPGMGLGTFFANNRYMTVAVPVAILLAILVQIFFSKTRMGYELRATGLNKFAAKYCGMNEKRNLILTLVIGGALAGLGGAMLYLTDYEQWLTTASTVPAMGFNGIAAAFLGGLNPIGAIFSSFFVQHITAGGAYVDRTIFCAQISDLISSIIIYLCGFVLFIRHIMDHIAENREKKIQAKLAEREKGGARA